VIGVGFLLRRLRRKRFAPQVAGSALAACWADDRIDARLRLRDVSLLAVDLETSALRPEHGEIVSAAWVALEGGAVRLDSAAQWLLRPAGTVGQSATVHGLRDCDLHGGADAADLLCALLDAARGRLLVFHHAPLDTSFLNALCQATCGAPLLLPYIDTVELLQVGARAAGQPLPPCSLRLPQARSERGLPAYLQLDALTDALATAELLLALAPAQRRLAALPLRC